MRQTLPPRALGLLALLAALAVLGVDAAPPGTHIGAMWPVGLAAGIVLRAPRGWTPAASGAVALVAALSYAVGGSPTAVTVGYALTVAVEALVTRQVLTAGERHPSRLRESTDLLRYLLGTLSGAVVGALGYGLTVLVSGAGTAWMVALAALVAHLTSQLILLSFFVETPAVPAAGGPAERVVRWVVAIAVTTAAFVPAGMPTLMFLVLPLLGWTALRATMREAAWHLVAILTIASTLTQLGLGPFGDLADTTGWPADLAVLPHYTFLLGCALVSIPFAMAVTSQRLSAAEAAQQRRRYERIVDTATAMAIVEFDASGRITLVNPGAEAILGYREDELLGRFPTMFQTPREIERQAGILGVPASLWEVAVASALPEHGPRDWQFVRKDGAVRTLSMTVAPLSDEHGAIVGYVATAEDITDRVRTLEALEVALDVERRAVTGLRELDRTKDAFVSSVSHELRTPITNIVGYLELLLDGTYGEVRPGQQEALGRIELNSNRLLELIDDLLTLSSVEALDLELSRSPVDLREVVRRTGRVVEPAARDRRLRLDLQLPASPVVVLGDAGHLERMLGSLAANAVKFTPDGGQVTLRALDNGAGAALEVEDTGIGIPEGELPHLFNRFYRASYAQAEAVQGSGLGLAIARTIAELHGARITATSTPGRGSTFRVTFAPTSTGL